MRRFVERERARLAPLPLLLLRDDVRRVWLPDEPDRERVLPLRDLGGEDVRVAMLLRLRDGHIRPTCNTPPAPRCDGATARDPRPAAIDSCPTEWGA